MTCRERIERIFKGELVDRVPFALKGWRISQCETERTLRNDGLCIIDSRPVYRIESPNTDTRTIHYTEGGVDYQRSVIKTAKGELTSLSRRVGTHRGASTSWQLEYMFKGPEDYEKILAMIEDQRVVPSYEPFLEAREQIGSDAYFKTGVLGIPLHNIMYTIMGLEGFATEWAERRERVLEIHKAMEKKVRQIIRIAAVSPAAIVQSGGNYTPEVLGKRRFIEYVLPHWEEAAAILHEGGKLLGCHLDAENRPWMKEIGDSSLDWIEAFTPAPDTSMSVAEAREAWPGKVLFINFPSSVHVAGASVIEETTKRILKDAVPGDRFIIGITENVPEERWRESYSIILRTCNTCGRLPIGS
jgi:hypothetical protein